MGAVLILPVVVAIIFGIVWVCFAAKRTRDAAHDMESLPTDPYERHEEQRRRLEREHAEADPTHHHEATPL